MDANKIYVIILGMAVVTTAARLIPVVVFSRIAVPKRVQDFLNFCPVAILCAMVAPAVFFYEEKINLSLHNKFFWVAMVCTLIAMRTKNIAISVLTSMALLAGWRWMMY